MSQPPPSPIPDPRAVPTNPITIRNARSPKSGLLLRLLLCVPLALLITALIGLGQPPKRLYLLVGLSVVAYTGGVWLFVTVSPWALSVSKLVLDDHRLRREPGRHYPLEALQSITLLPDPHEDYADDELPIRICVARIQPRWLKSFEMPLSAGDAARLQEWAKAHRLEVFDWRRWEPPHE